MEILYKVSILLALSLALSLLIERALEVIKATVDFADSRLRWYNYWTKQAEKYKDRLENKLHIFEYASPKLVTDVLSRFGSMLQSPETGYTGTLPVISGDMVRTATIKFYCKILGIALGIAFALWIKIDFIALWRQAAGGNGPCTILGSEHLRIIFSGIVIGLGSTPVHKIITTIDNKRKEKTEKGE